MNDGNTAIFPAQDTKLFGYISKEEVPHQSKVTDGI